ncbi:MAG: hemerythrin domain-containing protein [Nevskiaceae bacterium]|nr:MAG: hemerythrin domain-containing protein [Nevskiaceae bacterium]TBR71348.1 MAG: hemerythrin domain-containing protein [Nevskiaceae bacterium]
MTSITRWFGFGATGKGTSEKLKADKAAASISYSPQLVPALLNDHVELFKLYGDIEAALGEGQYDLIPNLLSSFKTRLDVHLLSENLRFYCYLEENLVPHPEELETMKGFRREMNDIARATVNFVRKWKTAGVTPASQRSFGQEATQIKALLQERMQREEQGLYPLYTP